MAQVAMTIAGRVYRVACGDGEEDHLGELAKTVDGKISGMREKFGEIGDQRLTVMAAVTLADELLESNRRVAGLEAELAQIRGFAASALVGQDVWIEGVAESLVEAAARIELVAENLGGVPGGDG
jgi:cell division protein ZapA